MQRLSAHYAAATLFSFGEAIQKAVAAHPGTEIRAEGDSYMCVCPTVSAALELGSRLLQTPLRGDHDGAVSIACGLVTESGDSPAHSLVEAAHLGALAPAGAMLVSDDVRRLAPTSELAYQRARTAERDTGSQGRVWLTVPPGPRVRTVASSRWGTPTLVGAGAAIGLVVVVALAGAWLVQRGANGAVGHLPPGPWTIAAQLPLSGAREPLGETLVNAVQMAIDDTNAQGGVDGQVIKLEVEDEGASSDTYLATASIDDFVADDSVLAVIGPLQSPHGVVDIPPTNAAGLLMCSPSNTNPGLTKPRDGALDLRSANPDRINYVRLITSDDIQGPAAAAFVYQSPTTGIPNAGIPDTRGLGIKQVLVVDDTSVGGRQVADAFQAAFNARGGTTERRAVNPGTSDYTDIVSPLADTSEGAWAVYYAGDSAPAASLKHVMFLDGYHSVPFVSWDGLYDGTGTDSGSFINLAGPAAANTFITQASIAPTKADFSQRYQETFGADPNPYAAAAYACTQVAIGAIQHAADQAIAAPALRDAVRAYAVDPANKVETSLGTVAFDVNGDSASQYVNLYATDMGANNGAGDWLYLDEQDFGPAP